MESPKNNYIYNGKELQDGLGIYDYGARLYDPVIARWNAVDPLAEDYDNVSPYIYGMNNPVLMVDPDGMAVDTTIIDQILEEVQIWADQPASDYWQRVGSLAARNVYGDLDGGEFTHTRGEVLQAYTTYLAKVVSHSQYGKPGTPYPKGAKPQVSRGAARARQFGSSWGNASLKKAIKKIAPNSTGRVSANGKKIIYDGTNGKRIVYDKEGNYFRIEDTSLSGKRVYTDLDGNVPNNRVEDGRVMGNSQSIYNSLKHFNNTDN